MITDQKEQTLVVARSTLFRDGKGQWAVFVIRNDRVKLKTVDVGLMNDEQVEILGGLDEDDAVVIAPENGLFDGTRVKPTLREGA
jgi:multidrug efflux pump subunit AcrA (membrane-fusion protein)